MEENKNCNQEGTRAVERAGQTAPVGDGVIITGNTVALKQVKMEKYCNPDHCISCAYFVQSKGHFGTCMNGKSDQKPYDGSKKGTGCAAWRLNSSLIQVAMLPTLPATRSSPDTYKQLREEHNRLKRSKRMANYMQKYEQNGFVSKNVDERFWGGLPYGQTSDTHNSRKYYKHKVAATIMEFAFKLIEERQSTRVISAKIYETFNYNISNSTIWHWRDKFFPSIKLPTWSPATIERRKKQRDAAVRYALLSKLATSGLPEINMEIQKLQNQRNLIDFKLVVLENKRKELQTEEITISE